MTYWYVACGLCGCQVVPVEPNDPVPWNSEFRAVCIRPRAEDRAAFLTGVGKHTNPRNITVHAPIDSQMHWSDSKFAPSASNRISPLDMYPVPEFEFPVGFLFHDACWSLLKEAFHPRPIPLNRLSQVLVSLPIFHRAVPNVTLDWGHDFGGAVSFDHRDYAPWEWHHREPPNPRLWPGHVFDMDPYHNESVSAAISDTPREPPAWPTAGQSPRPTNNNEKDCFLVLPMELCMAIAVLLPTRDALRARLASRAFWPVFYNPEFWMSRFKPWEPLGYLFETRSQPPADWRWLYRRTNQHLSYKNIGFINRRRIWPLARQIVDIVALRWRELLQAPPLPWTTDVGLRNADCERTIGRYTTRRVACDLKLGYKHQAIAIPTSLERVTVFSCSFGDGVYIVGMSLDADGQRIDLGYASQSHQTVELSQLYGFRVFVGRKGVRALQCLTSPDDTEARWLGSKGEGLETNHLATTVPVDGIEAKFDSTRMVGLTVFTPSPQPMDFRNAVLWDRAIPPCTLSLNGRGTYPRTWPNIPPIPMFWCHFGGPGGQYLKDLVGIAAVYHGHSFFQLAFSFENDDVPEEFRFLGGTRSVGNRSMITFDIDGPGGERIETVRITHEAPGEVTMSMVTGRPRILCFQILTNRGKLLNVFRDPLPWGDVRVDHVKASHGTAITGFYAAQTCNSIDALGAMTEQVNE